MKKTNTPFTNEVVLTESDKFKLLFYIEPSNFNDYSPSRFTEFSIALESKEFENLFLKFNLCHDLTINDCVVFNDHYSDTEDYGDVTYSNVILKQIKSLSYDDIKKHIIESIEPNFDIGDYFSINSHYIFIEEEENEEAAYLDIHSMLEFNYIDDEIKQFLLFYTRQDINNFLNKIKTKIQLECEKVLTEQKKYNKMLSKKLNKNVSNILEKSIFIKK